MASPKDARLVVFLVALAAFAIGRLTAPGDDNQAARFGDGGLPSNCRAYVQVAINAHAKREYSVDDIFVGLERNCGASGHLWKSSK